MAFPKKKVQAEIFTIDQIHYDEQYIQNTSMRTLKKNQSSPPFQQISPHGGKVWIFISCQKQFQNAHPIRNSIQNNFLLRDQFNILDGSRDKSWSKGGQNDDSHNKVFRLPQNINDEQDNQSNNSKKFLSNKNREEVNNREIR